MIDFYVSKTGDNQNPGTKEQPFATIEAARDAVRKLKKDGLMEAVTVHIEEGEYLTQGIVFEAQDSGTENCPVIYKGEGKVLINGGMTLDPKDFTVLTEEEKARLHGKAKEAVVRIDLTKLGLTRADWGNICPIGSYNTGDRYDNADTSAMSCELFFNDTRMKLARYPDEGYLYTVEPVREGQGREGKGPDGGPAVRKYTNAEWKQLRNPLGDINKIDAMTALRAASWQTLQDVWTFGYFMYTWADASSPVKRIDIPSCEMETEYVSFYGLREHAPYYFFNVFEELDAPGEWYLDREKGILYLYPISEMEEANIILSLLTDTIVKAEGISHITFEKLTFAGTRDDALKLKGDHITIRDCEIKNVAGNAVILEGEHCLVSGCSIHHTGKGGVHLTGGNRSNLTPSGNQVTNNHFHHIAQVFLTYQPAVTLLGCGNECSHNCIHDSAHMAIYFRGNDHRIEYNEIYQVCQMADDASAIYTGRDYTTCGTVIRCNYFHDIRSDADYHCGIFGIYCDDDNGGCLIEKNIFLRCQGALFLHGGQDMVFRNNLILEACEKSRCCIWFTRYGYWNDLWNAEIEERPQRESDHWRYYHEFERDEEIWNRAYPHFADYAKGDPETKQSYPHYAVLANNLIVNHKPIDWGFDYADPRLLNVVENNLEIPSLGGKAPWEIMPEFEKIPFEEIGLLKKEFVSVTC